MTCTTFLHDGELNQRLPDPELQSLLQEVRKATGRDWQVVSHTFARRGWFKRPVALYGLYIYVGGMGPWQQINFYRDGAETSINLYVPLELIAAYLYGVISQCPIIKEQP